MKHYGLLGEKLGHSFSPYIHAQLGDYEYRLMEVAREDLDDFFRERAFDGINVTVPYKLEAYKRCDALSSSAEKIGSVNTVLRMPDGSLYGDNTDYDGFRYMVLQTGVDLAGKKAVVLGSGGASKAVCAVLRDLGCDPVVVISRSGENNYGNISLHRDAAAVVNTTPVGMYPACGHSPLDLRVFDHPEAVFDLVYNPARTMFLQQAESLGIPSAGGLVMLVEQARVASMLFQNGPEELQPDMTQAVLQPDKSQVVLKPDKSQVVLQPAGTDSPENPCKSGTPGSNRPERFRQSADTPFRERKIVKQLTAELREQTSNIILVGMPGCGKSTLARTISEKTGRILADADRLIAEQEGKSIPKIFTESGEEGFRRIETRVLGTCCAKTGQVIACGGGVVTRPENLPLLRLNGVVCYIQRDLGLLPIKGRPLSQKHSPETLAAQRIPLYEAWADLTVRNDRTLDEASDEIIRRFSEYIRGI